ncbi:helix-turn-helix transcriptional regulator [Streptacidiphilus monticola]|jgi:DNA-binding transcriptional ArsR family regulator|uniref:Helix-turn-helix transcriptional regulator n=1 Tax=Streptacidiphilus monticola TaxID=2161674 RepID=A0ABW1G826_9ACTN
MSTAEARPSWTFLTNHARVLALIAKEPEIRLRDLAAAAQVTERTVQGIVADLEGEGYLVRKREGRRNRYEIVYGKPFRHPAEADHDVDDLLGLFLAHRAADEPDRHHTPEGHHAPPAGHRDPAGRRDPAEAVG